jgi:2-polyprenyl-6-hydroxyphenyl methylase/3-demethylubiquinone-9 3-methyltransferase
MTSDADARHEIEANERFAFGDNWRRFLDLVDEERIDQARKALAFLGTDDLTGKRFVDVGSGSGLSSLAARRMGADVVSFDFDPASVACTRELRRRFDSEDHWRVEQGSALDREFLASLGRFDVVYSWGVLHHTGDMWDALDAVVGLVAPGGLLWIALYNDQGWRSSLWTRIKRTYVHSGPAGKNLLLGTVGAGLYVRAVAADLIRGKGRRRGMDRWRDVVDWIGGWPFEVATPKAVQAFYAARGFETLRVATVGGKLGNNDFLFRKDDP